MPMIDAYGNPLSTEQAVARDAYDSGVALFLGGMSGAKDAFGIACTADPAFCLGHVARARALLLEGGMAQARSALAQAKALIATASDREVAHVMALTAFLDGAHQKCRDIVRTHAVEYPQDPMMMQLLTNVFGLIGFSGKVGREADLLAFTTNLMPHYGDDWWMMSMHGASLCETGQLDEAVAVLEASLALNPNNAHAAHFKAHTLYEAGETRQGRQVLGTWMRSHDSQGILHGHLTWHNALWALHDGDEAAMWDAVDTGVWPGSSSSLPINVLTDAASILYRADLAGISVPKEKWRALSNYAAQFFPRTGQSFVDIHAALCHAMAGEGDRLARISEDAKGFAGDLVRPVSQAWGHIARQNWQSALECLSGAMATHERLGGSRAQRDLLELTFANVLMRLGQTDQAHIALKTRRPILCVEGLVRGMAAAEREDQFSASALSKDANERK